MTYYAKFEKIDDILYRFDTRIYLSDTGPSNNDKCIGAIIGKNPGSASPLEIGSLAPLEKGKDKMLPYVRNRFIEGYKLSGKKIPNNVYIQVWNLFYLCNANLSEACKTLKKIKNPKVCATEDMQSNINWFAWGGNKPSLNIYKERFLSHKSNNGFYYNKSLKITVNKVPTITESAGHPQGSLKIPISHKLASLL